MQDNSGVPVFDVQRVKVTRLKPKTLILGIGALGIVMAASFLSFAPEDRINGIVEWYRRMNGSEGQICLDYYRAFMNDPDSSRLLGVERNQEGRVSLVVFKTKNRMGGYVKLRRGCGTFGSGIFDKTLAGLHESSVVMGEMTQCLEARNAIYAKGGKPDDRELDCTERAIWSKALGE